MRTDEMLFMVPLIAIDNIFLSNELIGRKELMKVKDTNYYVVQAWMVTRLGLKGLEKDLFAIIYGFSQEDESEFHGSLNYLSELTGYTKNRICDTLKHLTDINYIEKNVIEFNAIKKCSYRVNREILTTQDRPKDLDGKSKSHTKNLDGHTKDLDGKSKSHTKDLDVYISNTKNNKKVNKKDVREKTSHLLVETNSSTNTVKEFVDSYNDICKHNSKLSSVRVITDSRKADVLKILKKYGKNEINEAMTKVSNSDFLLGKTGGTWVVTFDWMFKEANFIKIIEGNYDNSKSSKKCRFEPDNVKSRRATKEEREYAEKMIREMQEAGEQYEF